MAAVMLFLRQSTGKTERYTHFCMPLKPVFTRDCGDGVHFTDEPTGALDSANARKLMGTFQLMNRSLGSTILMVTHDPLMGSYADRVLFLRDGKIWSEVYRGERSRQEMYGEIWSVSAALGGESDVF